MATEQAEFDERSQGGKGSTPTPDPTVLTTEALLREIAALRTLIDQRISSTEQLFETKILLGREGGMALKELLSNQINEKFASVDTQFQLVERQRVEQKQDTKAAVDAALAAAKEAVKEQTTASDRSITKSETATSEQLKQMNVTFTTAVAGIATPISDLKDRVTALEAVRLGARENRSDSRDDRGESRANMAIGISVAMGVLTIVAMILINAMHASGH
jgi:hypothetical protein